VRVWSIAVLFIPGVASAAIDPACQKAIQEAQAALRKADTVAAIAAADRARSLSKDPAEGGEGTATALRVAGEAEMIAKRYLEAAARFRDGAHLSAGNHRLWRSLMEKRVAALDKATRAEQAGRIKELLKKDEELMRLARSGWVAKPDLPRAEKALDEAAAALRSDKDLHRASFAQAVKGRVLAYSGEPDRGLELLKPWTKDLARPRFIREQAIDGAMRAAASKKDLEAEAGYALQLDALKNEALEPAQRRYTRSSVVQKACDKLEKSQGAGRCAILAKELTGEYSFFDPWRAKPKATLTSADITAAQEQYLPLLKQCIADVMRARPDDEMFQDAELKVAWAVTSTGTAKEIEVTPKRYDKVFGRCLRERIGWFRYPRAKDGQTHSVSIPYELDVTERIGRR
jgi:hypothetical protein